MKNVSGYDLMKYYHDCSEIEHDADTAQLAIDYQKTIKVGKFLGVAEPKNLPTSLKSLTLSSPVSLTATDPLGKTAKPMGLHNFLTTYSNLPFKTFLPV